MESEGKKWKKISKSDNKSFESIDNEEEFLGFSKTNEGNMLLI